MLKFVVIAFLELIIKHSRDDLTNKSPHLKDNILIFEFLCVVKLRHALASTFQTVPLANLLAKITSWTQH